MSNPHEIRVSASRLKTLKECTLLFWYTEIQRLPENTHWKTKVGSQVHLLFECLTHPRRRALLEAALTQEDWSADKVPALARFIRWQLVRWETPLSSVEEIAELFRVALLGIRPYFVDAEGRFTPPPRVLREHRFKLKVGAATLSGFIDLLLIWPDRAVCIDLKTQREKFTRADVPNNIQAIIYQLACYREFGFVPPVEFVMLRHPPSKRYPRNHVQRVEPPSTLTLAGLQTYVEYMYGVVNQFSMQDALCHPHDDVGFCQRVCQFREPFSYWAQVKKADPHAPPLKTYRLDKAPASVPEDETLVLREHGGCLVRGPKRT